MSDNQSDINTLRDMLRAERELLPALETKRAEGKRHAAVVWAVVRCQARIAALTAAIEALGGAL